MSTDYPPLPRPGDTKAPVVEEMLSTEGSSANTASSNKVSKSDPDVPTVICHRGDVIIEYTEQSSAISRRWQVSSKSLMRNSPYFQAMLDPDKFAEGRLLAHQKENQAQHSKLALSSDTKVDSDAAEHSVLHDLPTVKLSESPLTRMCGADAIGVFLKILCVGAQDLKGRYAFENELRAMPPSIVERTIEISEAFSSSGVVIETLKRAMYMFGRTKMVMKKFNEIFLKWSEDRVRQNIIIAISLQETQIAQVMMHTLIVMGSKYWVNGPEVPTSLYPRWRYLAHGIEEELYHRRQCIMNTITDLQAHFLRIYGALEQTNNTKPTNPRSGTRLGASFSTSHHTPQFQCRAGLGNGSQCDLFHLGQMTRFFALRAKTVFLGSTLIDPDFSINEDDAKENEQDGFHGKSTDPATPSGPPSDLTAIIGSLKQYPDYQIDTNHQGCGVRRRFLPVLAGIEKFILDPRGLLGIDIELWKKSSSRRLMDWRGAPGASIVDIRFDRIVSIHFPAVFLPGQTPQDDDAKLLFTAKKRNWEA